MTRTLFSFFLILFLNTSAHADDFKLVFPVDCSHGLTCWILNYMDVQRASPAAEDYTCGARTYDGHTGTDIAIRDLKQAELGVAVRAARDGLVAFARDDIPDSVPNPAERPSSVCGNGLVLVHESGWETHYCHLKQGSIPFENGEKVSTGQKIGEIGLSGASTWPHLGFTVLRNGQPFDPMSGRTALEGCGLTPKPLWKGDTPLKYQPFSVFNLGFAVYPPPNADVDVGAQKFTVLPADTPSLSFWAATFGLEAGDRVTLQILSPENDTLRVEELTIETPLIKGFFSLSLENPAGLMPAGAYTGLVTLKRGAGKGEQETSWKRIIEIKG